MAISASGFPGDGLAGESTSSLQSQLKGGGRGMVVHWLTRPGSLGLSREPGELGVGQVSPQQESVGRALESRCPPRHGPHLSTATSEPLSPDDMAPGSWVQSASFWGDVRTKVLALKQNYLPN